MHMQLRVSGFEGKWLLIKRTNQMQRTAPHEQDVSVSEEEEG